MNCAPPTQDLGWVLAIAALMVGIIIGTKLPGPTDPPAGPD